MSRTFNAETKTITYDTTGLGMDGGPMVGRNVVVYEGEIKRTMTMYAKIPDGDTMVKA